MSQPYFATHAVGVLYFLVILTWYSAEIIMFFRQLQWRKKASRVAERRFWAFFGLSVIVAIIMLYLLHRSPRSPISGIPASRSRSA